MGGGSCEVVRAETADLDRFVDRGEGYRSSLRAVFDGVGAARARTVALMGAADVPPARTARPLGGLDPLAELIAEATVADAFAREVSAALAATTTDGVVGLVPAERIDAALRLAGLDRLGRDRAERHDVDLVDELAVRDELRAIVAAGSGLPDHLQGQQVGLALEDYLASLDAEEAAGAAEVLVDYGIDLQAVLDPGNGDWPGRRTASTMLVTQGLLLWPGDRVQLVDDLAERWVPMGDGGRERALTLVVDALDLEQSNDDLTIIGLDLGPWQRANQPFVRQAVLSELIQAARGPDGRLTPGGQRLVDEVLDRAPGVVELSAVTWHQIDLADRHQNTPDGRACRVWPSTPLLAVLATALAAPNYGLDDVAYDAALALDELTARAASDVPSVAAEGLAFEREVLITLLSEGDPERMVLLAQALATGLPAADAVRLATVASEAEATDARVRRLRLVYDTTPWGDPVAPAEVDPDVLPPAVALMLGTELGVLQNVQLARFADGRPVPELPLSEEQVELVARYREVARWFHHRFAGAFPGGAEDAVDFLDDLGAEEMDRVLFDMPDGFPELVGELTDPANQVVWDLLAGASGNDTFLGPDGTYRPANGHTVVSADAEALLVQLALLRELGPYQELLDENGSGVIHEDEVGRWLDGARGDPSIPPALVDRVAVGTSFGVGEDTFGWDEFAGIIGLIGLAAAVVATTIYSGGTAAPLWVKGGLVGLAALEGYAAYQADDNVGAVLAGVGGLADVVAAARLLRLSGPTDPTAHSRLLTLAERSELPTIRALARQADELTEAQFASRYRAILDDLGYDQFLDVIATRSLDEQLEIVRNIERIDQRFVPLGKTDPKTGHGAARHGPHVTDEAMAARAEDLGFAVSRWSTWRLLDEAGTAARAAMVDEAWVLTNRGTAGDPIRAKGWAQVDAGSVTVDQLLADPQYADLLKKKVEFDGSRPGAGTRFHPDGTQTVDDTYRVVLLLDSSGTYRMLTAFPTT